MSWACYDAASRGGNLMPVGRTTRRAVIAGLGVAAVWTSPVVAVAQTSDKRPRRIAYLGATSISATANVIGAFLEGLGGHGYVEGRDFEMDYRLAEGHYERIPILAEELVRSKPDRASGTG